MVSNLQVPEFRVAYTVTTYKLDTLYKKLKPKGVTMTALLAKAAGVALSKHPIMHAGKSLSHQNDPLKFCVAKGPPVAYKSNRHFCALTNETLSAWKDLYCASPQRDK